MKKCKQFLALLLVLCMTLSVVPFGAFADDSEPAAESTGTVVDESEPAGDSQDPDESEDSEAPEDPEDSTGASNEDPVDSTEASTDPQADPAGEEPSMDEDPVEDPEEDDPQDEITPMSITKARSVSLGAGTFYRIFHLDCGRKYFSVDQIKDLIDTLAANNYTHIELAVGNDGLRFLLDDMSVEANNATYTSEAVKAGIQAGNKAYYDAGTNELSESEMNTIISYANGKGIGVIPLINTPGHMDAILDCMESVGISNPAYSNSARTVDVTNTEAVNFTLALVNKYIQYFSGKCDIFNMGCDEYANDISNSGFAGLISNGKYGNFVTYVNQMAALVQNAGMTPMAFNDGIYYNGNTSGGTFDSNIAIAYWTSGWGGYSPASASFLAGQGHKIINTNDAWYYVLGRTSGSYTLSSAQNGVSNTRCTDIPGDNDLTAYGCMICLWCDSPSAYYSNAEVSNVNGLLSTLATSNPTEFAAPIDPDAPVEKTINLIVGETATDTIEGVDYTDDVDKENLNEGIATVSARFGQVPGGKKTQEVTSITSGKQYLIVNTRANKLLTDDSNGDGLSLNGTLSADSAELWTITTTSSSGYTIQNANSRYLTIGSGTASVSRASATLKLTYKDGTWTIAQDVTSGIWPFETTTTYYLNDYKGQGTIAAGWNGDGASTDAGSQWKIYEIVDADPVDATTVTFTGKSAGTTYVTVGNTRYTINVVAEDLSNVTSLPVEYWITNLPVTAGGATSTTISAQSVYGEAGVDLSTLVPETGSYDWGDVVYWKGTVLDANNHQTSASGVENDKTGAGKDFNKLRYYNGSWQYFYEADGTWNTISSTDQVVAYWLQPTEVTKEITTLVKDWGYSPDGQGNDSVSKVALTVAVVYPDGTVSPAEGNMYSQSTTLFNYWTNRDIGLVAPINNSDYEISKITVTDGKRDQSGIGQWGINDTITWEKVTNEAGQQWYDETTYWTEADGGTPMVNGLTSGITWPNYNTAKLVLIYLKPVHYDTNLLVKWVDDSAGGAEISSMEIAVSSDGTPITFYNGLKQTSALPAEGVGGTFTLDDNAYVTNSSNVNQTFNKKISIVPGVAEQYKSGLYQYAGADLSADGKTLTLHYNINSTKLNAVYVVDFGLPVNVPLSELVDNFGGVSKVEITGGDAEVNEDNSITYRPKTILTGTATVVARLTYTDGTSTIVRIGFVPATTVYYEESFISFTNQEATGATYLTGEQVSQKKGVALGNFGYDTYYTTQGVGSSNGTAQLLGGAGSTGVFTFTGTGFEIFADCLNEDSWVSVVARQAETDRVAYVVNASVKPGDLVTTDQGDEAYTGTYYSLPIVSKQGLPYGTYTVTISKIVDNKAVYIDGIRIFDTDPTTDFTAEKENNPSYMELRDMVLTGLSASQMIDDSQYAYKNKEGLALGIYEAVYANTGALNGAVVLGDQSALASTNEEIIDLLDNGPKNELYLWPGMAVTFNLGSSKAQIGMKTVWGNAVTAKLTIGSTETDKQINSSTDMFYSDGATGEVTITNPGSNSGILSITLLKFVDPDASTTGLSEITQTQIVYALRSLSLSYLDDSTDPVDPVDPPVDPVDPEEPDVKYADAELTVSLVDYTGKKLGTASLTANGVVGEVHTFTAQEILAAAKAQMPAKYAFVDESAVKDMTVGYGAPGTVSVQVGKVTTLKVTYVGLFGRKVGTATITKVQTSAGACQFTAAEIRSNAPASARRVIWLTNVSVSAGSERNLIVSVF